MKRKSFYVVTLIMLAALARTPLRAAETSQTIAFRGCDASLAGAVDLRLRLFDAAAGGNMVFEETQAGVAADAAGCVSVRLGDVTPLAATLFTANPSLWVAFALAGAPDTELGGGRTAVTANGYAFRAVNADQLGGVPAGSYLQTTGGSVSASSPGATLNVTNTNPAGGAGLTGESQSAQGTGGLFVNSAGGDLLQGKSDTGGAALFRVSNSGGAFFNGNVGIGQSNPQNLLHVGPGTSSVVAGRVNAVVASNTADAGIAIAQNSGVNVMLQASGVGGYLGTTSNHPLIWRTNDLDRMVVSANGNVGIGIAPGADIKLDVGGRTVIRPGGTGGDIHFGTPNTETGMTVAGANRADVRFDGSTLKLLAGAGPGVPASTSGVVINTAGNVGIGTVTPTTRLDVNGTVKARVVQITGADFSEKFEVRDTQNKIEPGMVVAIDPASPGKLAVSRQAYDRRVAGILSGAGGINTGMLMGQPGTLADGNHAVALSGRVYVWADASVGAIVPGDLLTTSNVPGHAMKVTNYSKAQGAILGKAMTGLMKGRGLVLVLVTLQ